MRQIPVGKEGEKTSKILYQIILKVWKKNVAPRTSQKSARKMKHNTLHPYNKWEQKGAIPVVNKRIVCIVIVRRVGMLYEPIGKLSVHREKTDEGLVMVERRLNKTNKQK
jgi:hypothetical protein